MKIRFRFIPLLALAILALLFAMWAGLLRLGWRIPSIPNLALAHGPLMVSGFLGVLIPLERAVAIRKKWMYASPIAAGVGWVSLLFAPTIGAILMTFGSVVALLILLVMVRREPVVHTITMAIGVLSWVIGNILWTLGFPIAQLVHWWIGFFILTIGGERLELSRVLRPTRQQTRIFSGLVVALLGGAILAMFNDNGGARLSGAATLALALWFLKNDLAARNIHHPNPLTRYIAYCLFLGFIWLGIGGTLQLIFGAGYAGPIYDAMLHTIFVGFVISMIFGHSPIIFPAILGVPINYYPSFYIHFALLHASLLLRVAADLTNQVELRRVGGLLNEVAIVLFLAMTVYSVVKHKQ
ncbi:MAG: hypothetical protein HS124_01235 [Anaerolineales bacterium]|nr:hypothetical protein [Anaerolineales bacterium]